jgi:hypothetical protein
MIQSTSRYHIILETLGSCSIALEKYAEIN